MSKQRKLQLACVVVLAIICAGRVGAFNPSVYATTSKLASGKWVKVSIPENGVYEITYDELLEMGFSDPTKVSVFGTGGAKISEVLNGTAADDLKRIPFLRINNKICFYGCGPVSFSISDYNTSPRFTRMFNPYSQVGCYFLGDIMSSDLSPSTITAEPVSNYINTPTSLGYFYYEKELSSPASSGKEMLGDDFSHTRLLIEYNLPNLADSTVIVHTAIAANMTQQTYATAVLHSGGATDTTNYSRSMSLISMPTTHVFYNFATPQGRVKLTHPAEHGKYEPFLPHDDTTTVTLARLDYFILSYMHSNILNKDGNQVLMGYGLIRGNERIQLPNASSSTVVWSIKSPSNPQSVALTPYDDESGKGLAFFSSNVSSAQFIAFDPAKTLKKVIAWEPVANQNLHGMAVPDMLIITDKSLHEQAQRVADLHATVDGISVAVVDQDQVFNEFSSGTRDGMAYRLFCKMLYDRDATKFKNLLLFGSGTFDNRELMGEHPGALLTYQSDNSNHNRFTYTTDDFFGFMDDNSGGNLSSAKLRIGVGRMTCGDVEEAASDVDKLVEYYANPDYGVWRNNTMVATDSPDYGQYMFQGESYKNLIDNELNTGMHVSTIHNTQYARSNDEEDINLSHKTAVEGKQMWSNLHKDGLYFTTFVGHAGPIAFTKYNKMWTTLDVAATNYSHWPIMSTACCDVAHYDNDNRGIAELMFHKRDGGAIALMASSRMVLASANDKLNSNFIKALFSYDKNGVMPTLGEAYKQSKLAFTTSDSNKLSFFLLGDPAIKVNYPISRFQLMEVNGADMTDPNDVPMIRPLRNVEVVAHVLDAGGNLDTSFNGDATMSLYDKEEQFTTVSYAENGTSVSRKIYFNRDKLAEVTGRVVNGVFNASIIVPDDPKASNEMVLMRVYAHKDNSDYMVNGFSKSIKMLPYNKNMAINDTQSPVITSMYINDESSFTYASTVGSNSILYITATDDQAICIRENSVEKGMSLMLDGGKPSYRDISYYASLTDGGRTVNIEFPLNNLSEGMHTLTYKVYDMLGNSDERMITFMVGQSGVVELTADKLPAYCGESVSFDVQTELSVSPEVIVRVTDALGNLVWMKHTQSFPVAWDMKDMHGNTVPAGMYRYFGTYYDGVNYGGTSIGKLIVLEPVKTAN